MVLAQTRWGNLIRDLAAITGYHYNPFSISPFLSYVICAFINIIKCVNSHWDMLTNLCVLCLNMTRLYIFYVITNNDFIWSSVFFSFQNTYIAHACCAVLLIIRNNKPFQKFCLIYFHYVKGGKLTLCINQMTTV